MLLVLYCSNEQNLLITKANGNVLHTDTRTVVANIDSQVNLTWSVR